MANRYEQLEKTFNLPSLSELSDDDVDELEDESLDDEDENYSEESYDELREQVEKMSRKLKEYDNMGELSSQVTKKYNEDIDALHNIAKNGYEEIFTAALTMDPAHGSKFLNGAAKLLEIAVRSKNASIDKQLDMAKLQLEREKLLRNTSKSNRRPTDIEGENDDDMPSYGVGENGGTIYDRNEIIRQYQEKNQDDSDEPPIGDEPS